MEATDGTDSVCGEKVTLGFELKIQLQDPKTFLSLLITAHIAAPKHYVAAKEGSVILGCSQPHLPHFLARAPEAQEPEKGSAPRHNSGTVS